MPGGIGGGVAQQGLHVADQVLGDKVAPLIDPLPGAGLFPVADGGGVHRAVLPPVGLVGAPGEPRDLPRSPLPLPLLPSLFPIDLKDQS